MNGLAVHLGLRLSDWSLRNRGSRDREQTYGLALVILPTPRWETEKPPPAPGALVQAPFPVPSNPHRKDPCIDQHPAQRRINLVLITRGQQIPGPCTARTHASEYAHHLEPSADMVRAPHGLGTGRREV